MNKIPLWLIDKYQKNKTSHGHCHFYPSCSNYAKEAYQKFNFFYASFLTFFRIIRCTPFTKRKYDPVPLTKKEKRNQVILNELKENYDSSLVRMIYQMSFKTNISKEDFVKPLCDYIYGPSVKCSLEKQDKLKIEYYYDGLIKTNQNINLHQTYIPKNNIEDIINIFETLCDNGIINLDFTITKEDLMNNYSNDYYLYPSSSIKDELHFEYLKPLINKANFIGIDSKSYTPIVELILDYLNIELINLNELFNDDNNKELSTKLLEQLSKRKVFVYNQHIYDFSGRKKYLIIKDNLVNGSNSCIFDLTIGHNVYNPFVDHIIM